MDRHKSKNKVENLSTDCKNILDRNKAYEYKFPNLKMALRYILDK